MIAYKVLTHDLRSPIQGGDPIWDGYYLPYQLPVVTLDRGPDECAAGWNACRRPETALQIAGLWPDGWPSRLFELETDGEVVERGTKLRAATWTVTREVDVRDAIRVLSQPFGDLADEIAAEQVAWHVALGRPRHDPEAVEEGLRAALDRCGLDWQLKRFDNAWDTWAAWDTWDTWTARDTWDARVAWAARAARDTWDARVAWAARFAWAARAAWDARAARDARDARDALIIYVACCHGWIDGDPRLLTVGLRWAYRNGLAVAIPTGPDELGWALVSRPQPEGMTSENYDRQ